MMLKNRWKKAACLILTIISTVCLGKVDVKAADYWPDAPETLSPSVILMEESTGTILYEKNMDEAHYPASITKIMTTLLALENGNLSDMVTFSDDAINNTEGSGIARDYGEQMTLEQCLYGVMLESANECAYAVAEHIGGGDVSKFVNMMNEKAKAIGAVHSHFANPNGLTNPDHYTTAEDMALISAYAMKNPDFRDVVKRKTYPMTYRNGIYRNVENRNEFLSSGYPGANGIKTGMTEAAGDCLVASAERDGRLVIVTLYNDPNRWNDTKAWLDYGFRAAKAREKYDAEMAAEPKVYKFVNQVLGREARA